MTGTVVIDEQIYPIKDVSICEGGFAVQIELVPKQWKQFAGRDVQYAVFSADGLLAYIGRIGIPANDFPYDEGATVVFTLQMKVNNQTTDRVAMERGLPSPACGKCAEACRENSEFAAHRFITSAPQELGEEEWSDV